MENTEANDAGRQRRPGIHDHTGPVITNQQLTKPPEPADRPLDNPVDLTKSASMLRLPLGNVRLDTKPAEQLPQRLTVIAPVGVGLVGQLLGVARSAVDHGEVEDHREEPREVAGVGHGGVDR